MQVAGAACDVGLFPMSLSDNLAESGDSAPDICHPSQMIKSESVDAFPVLQSVLTES